MLKTVKSLRFLCYLQPKKLVCQSFIDAGSRLETPGSERKNFKKTFKIQQAGQCELCVCISSSSLSKSQGGKAEQGETTYSVGFYHSWGTPVFYNGPQAKLPNLCLEVDIIFIILGSNKPASAPETLSLSSKVTHYTNILEKTIQNKRQSVPLHIQCAKHGRPMENGLPKTQ